MYTVMNKQHTECMNIVLIESFAVDAVIYIYSFLLGVK